MSFRERCTAYVNKQSLSKWNVSCPRNTCAAFVLITFQLGKDASNTELRNAAVKVLGILKAYGHGEIFGVSREGLVTVTNGLWASDHGIVLLSFDHEDEAVKFVHTTTRFREPLHIGSYEIITFPLVFPPRMVSEYKLLQMDLYDMKVLDKFVGYIQELIPMVSSYGGYLICASQNINCWCGTRKPNFVIIVQWTQIENYHRFNQIATPLHREKSYACATRVLFTMECIMPF